MISPLLKDIFVRIEWKKIFESKLLTQRSLIFEFLFQTHRLSLPISINLILTRPSNALINRNHDLSSHLYFQPFETFISADILHHIIDTLNSNSIINSIANTTDTYSIFPTSLTTVTNDITIIFQNGNNKFHAVTSYLFHPSSA